MAEYLGVRFDGREDLPSCVLPIIKCADYILMPMAGGALVFQIRPGSRWKNVLLGILVFNTVFQIASAIGGWMITIDAHNHYSHGPLYYIAVLEGLARCDALLANVTCGAVTYALGRGRDYEFADVGTIDIRR